MGHSLRRVLVLPFLVLPLGAQHMRTMGDRRPEPSEAGSAGQSRATGQAPFNVLDEVHGANIDLVFGPIRPMAVDAERRLLFAVNTHNNTLLEFDADGLQRTIQVPWGPVSVATWSPRSNPSAGLLLVVCRGSYTLACVERISGQIVRLIDLPAEPADILVHPGNNHVFVSCPGDRSVVELAMDSGQIVRRYDIPAMQPTFLALDGDDLLVAPMLSGNNSTFRNGTLIDLADPQVAIRGLDDYDLFRISPGGTPQPVARGVGTLLFGLGKNPVTGTLWQLGTEAKNKDPKRRGEPALRGDFVSNRLSLIDPLAGVAVIPSQILDLDDSDPNLPGVQFDASRTVGQPFGLAFDGQGQGYVTGQLSQNVTQLSAAGIFLREWNVGSIPRAILVGPAAEHALVYCWGDNTIERYDLRKASPVREGVLDLGFDPTPDLERAGRKLFFDGSFSEHGNASCASCHVETGTDMLVWDLSDLPFDDKGPFVTQTMKGIGDHFPMHWRGERRDLSDFNGAFAALLGGTPLDRTPGGEFDQFEAYIKSLQEPANPFMHPDRVLDAGLDPAGGNAIIGQDIFFDDTPTLTNCNNCHSMPTGTNSEPQMSVSDPLGIERRSHVRVPAAVGLWRKEQPTLETVQLTNGGQVRRSTNGVGLTAVGTSPNTLEFLRQFFQLTPQEELDLAAFMRQADSGLAPAVHRSWLLNQGTVAQVRDDLEHYLLGQAAAGNVDIALFGSLDLGGGFHALRWSWDVSAAHFVAESSAIPARTMDEFLLDAEEGRANVVVLGLPIGVGQRFSVDFDSDGLFNLDELRTHTDPFRADSDGDGYPDGHEVAHGGIPTDASSLPIDITAPGFRNMRLVYSTAKTAKIQFETDEPARIDASWSSGASSGALSSPRYETVHTVLLTDLGYKKLYRVPITATDYGGNQTTMRFPGGVRSKPAEDPSANILRNLSASLLQNSGGVLHFSLTGEGHAKFGTRSILGTKLKASVFVNGAFRQTATGTRAGSDGISTLDIQVSGLTPGDVVRVVIQSLGVLSWNMPETLPSSREQSLTYDGTGS